MPSKNPAPKPPAHLTRAAKAWWREIRAEYDIQDSGGLSLLGAAAEAMDRCTSAREAIDANGGPIVLDRFQQPKPHPACAIERDARGQFIQAIRALELDVEPAKKTF